tara:strand:+ start:2117 stop:3751 length:1635 start_codon:yes stop_codon:yes gene_type:complete
MAEQNEIKALQAGISSSFRDTMTKIVPSFLQQQLNNSHQKALQDDRIEAQANQNLIATELKMVESVLQLSDNPKQVSEYMTQLLPQLKTNEAMTYVNSQVPGLNAQGKVQDDLINERTIYQGLLDSSATSKELEASRRRMNNIALGDKYLTAQQASYITNDERTRYYARKGIIDSLNIDGLFDKIVNDDSFQIAMKNPAITLDQLMRSMQINIQNEYRDKLTPSDLTSVIQSYQRFRENKQMGRLTPELIGEVAEIDTQIENMIDMFQEMTKAQLGLVKPDEDDGNDNQTDFSLPSLLKENPALYKLSEAMAIDAGVDFNKSTQKGISKLSNAIISGQIPIEKAVEDYNLSPDEANQLLKDAEKFIKIFKEETVLSEEKPDSSLVSPLTTPDSTLVTPDSSLISPDSLTTTQSDSLELENVPLDPTSSEIEENFKDPKMTAALSRAESGKQVIDFVSEVVGDIADATNIVNTPEYLQNLEKAKNMIKTGQYSNVGIANVSAFASNSALLVINGMQQLAKSLEPGEKLSNFNLPNFISQLLGQNK